MEKGNWKQEKARDFRFLQLWGILTFPKSISTIKGVWIDIPSKQEKK